MFWIQCSDFWSCWLGLINTIHEILNTIYVFYQICLIAFIPDLQWLTMPYSYYISNWQIYFSFL